MRIQRALENTLAIVMHTRVLSKLRSVLYYANTKIATYIHRRPPARVSRFSLNILSLNDIPYLSINNHADIGSFLRDAKIANCTSCSAYEGERENEQEMEKKRNDGLVGAILKEGDFIGSVRTPFARGGRG